MEKQFYFHTSPTSKKKNKRVTVAGVLVDNQMRFGVSICSNKDIFVKEYGRAKAHGRALSKEEVAKISDIPTDGNLGEWFVENAIDILKTNNIKCEIKLK